MKVLLVENAHMYKTPDGRYYTPSIYNKAFFQRYLNVFSGVRFVAKTKYVDSLDTSSYIEVDFDNVEVYELPWARGIKEYIKRITSLMNKAIHSKEGCDCTIYRVAQFESFLVYLTTEHRKPFALEVINDPLSWTSNGVIRFLSAVMLKHMCKRANGVSYVTQHYLQNRYPVSKKRETFTTNYSSIELDSSMFGLPKTRKRGGQLTLIHVANVIDGNGKGHDTVLSAVKELIERGQDVTIRFIGDGPGVDHFKKQASSLGISDSVIFIGRISDKERYMKTLRENDILIFPSHSEGLPRVVIEAMACGLPCVASPVGGTPELLDEQCLVGFNDYIGYADAIERLANDTTLYFETSVKNISKAKEYEKHVLSQKKTWFYKELEKLCISK